VHSVCWYLPPGASAWGSVMASVAESALASLMAEVDDPALQRKVLRLAVAATRADRHLAHGEALVLDAARRHWGLADETEADRAVAAAPVAA